MIAIDSNAKTADGKKVVAELDRKRQLIRLKMQNARVRLAANGHGMDITGCEHVHLRGALIWVLLEP